MEPWVWRRRGARGCARVWVGAGGREGRGGGGAGVVHGGEVVFGCVVVEGGVGARVGVRLVEEIVVRGGGVRARDRGGAVVEVGGGGVGGVLWGRVCGVAGVEGGAGGVWGFFVRVPDAGRSWGWWGVQGEGRGRVWGVEVRFRIVADVFDADGGVVATGSNFVTVVRSATGEEEGSDVDALCCVEGARDGIRARAVMERLGAARVGLELAPSAPRPGAGVAFVVRGVAATGAVFTHLGEYLCLAIEGAVQHGGRYAVMCAVDLLETVEVRDPGGRIVVRVTHRYPLRSVSPVSLSPTGRAVAFEAAVRAPIPSSIFSPDARLGDHVRISHAAIVTVSYQRERSRVRTFFSPRSPGAAAQPPHAPAVDSTGAAAETTANSGSTTRTVTIVMRRARQLSLPDVSLELTPELVPELASELLPDPPTLAVWGSTVRIPIVGTSQLRAPHPPPAWVGRFPRAGSASAVSCILSDDLDGASSDDLCNPVDALRRLAYEKAAAAALVTQPPPHPPPPFVDILARLPCFRAGADMSDDQCPICMEAVAGTTVAMLPCLHAGHRRCLAQSLARRAQCPVCRHDLLQHSEGVDGVRL